VRRRIGVPALCAVAAFVAAGCAIPTQNAPSPIAPSKVPFGLLNPHPPTTTTTQPKPSSLVPVKVFFLVCVVVAGIFGAFTVAPVNWVLLLGQALPGALALGSLWLSEGKRAVVQGLGAIAQ